MDQTQIRSPDVHGRAFQMDEQTLGVMIARLEARGRHPFLLRAIDDCMAELAPAGTESVLDPGCGTGVAARAIARRPEVRGPVTAIDISPHFAEAARRLADQEGLGGRIDVRVGTRTASGCRKGRSTWRSCTPWSATSPTRGGARRGPEAAQAGHRAARRRRRRLRLADPGHRRAGGRRGDRPGRAAGHHRPAARHAGHAAPAGGAGLPLAWSRAYVGADIGRADHCAPMIASLRVLLPRAGAMPEA
jgi:Methyltransferase domain